MNTLVVGMIEEAAALPAQAEADDKDNKTYARRLDTARCRAFFYPIVRYKDERNEYTVPQNTTAKSV